MRRRAETGRTRHDHERECYDRFAIGKGHAPGIDIGCGAIGAGATAGLLGAALRGAAGFVFAAGFFRATGFDFFLAAALRAACFLRAGVDFLATGFFFFTAGFFFAGLRFFALAMSCLL